MKGFLTNVWHEDVYGLCECRVVFAPLHVEGFDVGGESVEHDRLANLVGHETLRGLGNVLTNLEFTKINIVVSLLANFVSK